MSTKTFEAIEKLKEVELELHRLKNGLEMANRALNARDGRIGTHGPTCYLFGPAHYECALSKIADLESKPTWHER
jgi:hypothetical protein